MLLRGAAAAFLLVASLSCGEQSASNECGSLTTEECTAPAAALIVDTAWLEEHLDDSDVQLIDTRDIGYEESRIPGAIHLLPGQLSATLDRVPSQIKAPGDAETVLRAAGLRNDAVAVVYGAHKEYDPSRIVWSLSYYRHADVRYLDGGYAAWVNAGGELETDPPSVEASEYTIVGIDQDLRATGAWMLEQLGAPPYLTPAIQLVDARSQGEYDRGRIPSASSVDWMRNLDGGFLRPQSHLEALYAGFDPTVTTVTYCVSGWRGSFAWLTLTALGYEDVRLYDGSWNEWGSGAFPIEQ